MLWLPKQWLLSWSQNENKCVQKEVYCCQSNNTGSEDKNWPLKHSLTSSIQPCSFELGVTNLLTHVWLEALVIWISPRVFVTGFRRVFVTKTTRSYLLNANDKTANGCTKIKHGWTREVGGNYFWCLLLQCKSQWIPICSKLLSPKRWRVGTSMHPSSQNGICHNNPKAISNEIMYGYKNQVGQSIQSNLIHP